MVRLQIALTSCLLGAFLLIGVTGCGEAPAAVAPQPPIVSVMHPEQRELTDHEEFNGWMAADKSVEVRSRVRGHIKKVNFTDGQYVKKGDLLFELDPRPFQAEIGAIADKVRIYEAQKTAADRDAARYRELLPQRAASQKDLDKAEATAASFAAEVEATKNQLERTNIMDVLEKLKEQKATFKFARDGETGFKNEGTLQFGDNRIDPSTGTVQVY